MDVKGKLAVITGSAQGLGKAFAEKLLEEGANVCLSDTNQEIGGKTLVELRKKFGSNRVHFIRCDVTKREELEALYAGIETFFNAKVDIFCNNAGVNHRPGWRKVLDIDIYAVMEGTEVAMERMSREKGGQGGLIVNTASIAGLVTGWEADSASYFVAKHGVVSLTRNLGQKAYFDKTGVKFQCICPSFADTAILTDLPPGSKERIDKSFGLLTPEDVAHAFMCLIKKAGNGAAMCVMKDSPPFLFPDTTFYSILLMGFGGRLLNRLTGVEVFTGWHQLGMLLALFFILHIFLAFIFF